MEYLTEFYETETTNPDTCDVDYTHYHGVIYIYRKSWIRRRIKKKVLFHTTRSCSRYGDANRAREQVESEVKTVLKMLNKS